MKPRDRATDGPGGLTGAALFRQSQASCRDSLARLMAVHEGLVHAVVRKQILGHLPYGEALQAGRIGLWRAILGHDPRRGIAFSTYAWTSIMHHVWREGGLCYFLTALGRHSEVDGDTVLVEREEEEPVEVTIQYLNQFLVGAVTLIHEAGLLSAEAWNQFQVCPDGMLLHGASRLDCASVQESCYQPTSFNNPRPCPAKEKERQGCDCDTLACVAACHHATPRDAEARFVWYTGSNQPQSSPNRSTDPAPQTANPAHGPLSHLTKTPQIAGILYPGSTSASASSGHVAHSPR